MKLKAYEPHDKWKQQYLLKMEEQEKIVNPCVRTFGPGPTGAKCKDCKKLLVRKMSKNYYKCSLRKITSGAATDHRVGWDACSKYEETK